jgi:hypothetical protein
LVPPWIPSYQGGYTSRPLDATPTDNGLRLFNVPKISLNHLPKLDPVKEMAWLQGHAALTLSARERRIRHPSKTSPEGLLNFKDNLHALFSNMATSTSAEGRIFGLCYPEKRGVYALIVVSAVRLDLSAQTVVADAHVILLNEAVMGDIGSFLAARQKDVRVLVVSEEGSIMWKTILMASVERCREGIWEHQSTCEYKSHGASRRSILCSCGQGKVSDDFKSCKAYESLKPHAYRAAIGQIFAVPFFEQLFTG